MNQYRRIPIGPLILMWTVVAIPVVASADVTTFGNCSAKYETCLRDWKADRVSFLKSEHGYLNLAGLFWLEEGENTFGSEPVNDLVFPASAAPEIGSFVLRESGVSMQVNAGVDVRFNERLVAQMPLPDDTTRSPAVVTHGDLSWTVIKRDQKYAVRLRDFKSPILKSFAPIDYYPTTQALRITGKLHRYSEPRIIKVGTVIEGLSYNPRSPGVVQFELNGKSHELEAYDAAGQLFFVFADTTSRTETYPAGRFLYAEAPGPDGEVMLDFNIAQNPPCAFNEFATCPVASPRNRLPVSIEAGEKYERNSH